MLEVVSATADGTLDLKRVGLGYEVALLNGRVLARVDRLRESRGELSGELTVSLADGPDRTGLLHQARINLSSLSSRTGVARYLGARHEGPWPEAIDLLCRGILSSDRRGEPMEWVGDRPARTGPEFLLEPIVPSAGACTIFGAGGGGKSTLAAAIGLSLQTGTAVIPGTSVRQRRAPLVLDWEATSDDWNDTLARLAAGAGITDPPRVAYRRCDRPLVDLVETIAEDMAREELGYLIVDSVHLASGTGREGDPSDATARMYAALRLLRAPALLVDHVRGSDLDSERPAAKPYGDVFKTNWARSVFELRRERDGKPDRAELVLLHNKVNVGPKQPPQGLAIVYTHDAIRIERTDVQAPDLVATLSTRERMVRLLASGALRPKDIADELDAPWATVNSTASRHKDVFVRLPDKRIGLVSRQ